MDYTLKSFKRIQICLFFFLEFFFVCLFIFSQMLFKKYTVHLSLKLGSDTKLWEKLFKNVRILLYMHTYTCKVTLWGSWKEGFASVFSRYSFTSLCFRSRKEHRLNIWIKHLILTWTFMCFLLLLFTFTFSLKLPLMV